MFDMLVVQSNGGLTPLTPASSPPGGHHHHPTDLSPRSARSTSSSLLSSSPSSTSPTPIKDFHSQHLHHHQLLQDGQTLGESDDYSALQRLQYALERNSLFSNLFQNGSIESTSPILDLHNERRIEIEDDEDDDDDEEETPRPMNNDDKLNASIEDSEPRSTDSSSNLIESPTGSPNANPANIFQCPLCSIVCNGRHSFNEHLVTHTQQQICPKCDFLTNTEDDMREHLQECHDLTDFEGLTDDEVRVPKMNSQGKMKTFKCKQCQHISITKMEFWSHSKSHIRQEKMLTCPKCPFVTEYKHHLEYHLRNHFGSKPFVCTECSYTCVNKSMLNSHLKSHSTIYQYRCADCSYATKYCHSLKLHLRKYSHNPSAVLNPDGSQNPLTIIDVYGTRRGPKVKRPPPGSNNTSQIPSQISPNSNDGGDESGKGDDFETAQQLGNIKIENNNNTTHSTKKFPSDASDSMSDSEGRPSIVPMPEMNRSNFSTCQNPIQIEEHKMMLEQMAMKNPMELYAAALNQYLFANQLRIQPNEDLAKIVAKEQQEHILHAFAAAQVQSHPFAVNGDIGLPLPMHHPHPNLVQLNHSPLDLRQPQHVTKSRSKNSDGKNAKGKVSDDTKKQRKRKGKAQRYERQVAEDLSQHDEDRVLDFSNNNRNEIKKNVESNNLICKYCEISFLDKTLYAMHMRYHSGDADPFLCKSCGKKTYNKIAFSVHLTTDPH